MLLHGCALAYCVLIGLDALVEAEVHSATLSMADSICLCESKNRNYVLPKCESLEQGHYAELLNLQRCTLNN